MRRIRSGRARLLAGALVAGALLAGGGQVAVAAAPPATASPTTATPPTAAAPEAVAMNATATKATATEAAPTAAAPEAVTPKAAPTSATAPEAAAPNAVTPKAAASKAATSNAAPSGSTMPVGDLPHWHQVLRQDFTRTVALGRFAARYPGWSGYDGITDTSRETARPAAQRGLWNNRTTVQVHDGLLECRIHTRGVTPQVCAITPTTSGKWWKGATYGRYSVRFRADRMPGYKIAWLLWPAADDWKQGEIDFPEGSLAGTATGAAHRIGDPEWTPFLIDSGTRMTDWHTATISWRPGRVTFRLDDRTWTTTNADVVPATPMRWALQAESRIAAKAPDRAVRGRIQIDWLTEYRWRG